MKQIILISILIVLNFNSFSQEIGAKFKEKQSKVLLKNTSKTANHSVNIQYFGKLENDLTLIVEIDSRSSTSKGIVKFVSEKEVSFKKENFKNTKDSLHTYTATISFEIKSDISKIQDIETIVFRLYSKDESVKILNEFHTLFIHKEGLHNYLTTSIGTNFDYLNGGAQAKKIYWDVNYFDPAVNDKNIYIHAGVYQNRNISIDSTGFTKYQPVNYNILNKTMGANNVDTFRIQRQKLSITKDQLTVDNYGFSTSIGGRLNPISKRTNFYLGFYAEIIYRNFTRNIETSLSSTDTINVIINRNDTLTLNRGIRTGITTSNGIDNYNGLTIIIEHIAKSFIFRMSPTVTYGLFDIYGSNFSRGLSGIVKLQALERNTGINLGFEYRSSGTANNLISFNLSKTFSISKSEMFKKL